MLGRLASVPSQSLFGSEQLWNPSSMGRRLLSSRSFICVLVVCFLANSLRNFFFAPLDDRVQLVSVIELDSHTSSDTPFLDHFPEDARKDQVIQVIQEEEELQPTPLGTHHYGDDGLLVVNHDGPHPIFELIQRAEEAWTRKLDRASKTLEEAVAEYKRRYKRPPPLHFDIWCVFIIESKLNGLTKELYFDFQVGLCSGTRRPTSR